MDTKTLSVICNTGKTSRIWAGYVAQAGILKKKYGGKFMKTNIIYSKYSGHDTYKTTFIKKAQKTLEFLGVATVLAFVSCSDSDDVGMGEAVDLEPPVVSITTPLANESVAHTFMIKGTASDNKEVTSLQVAFEDDTGISFHYNGSSWTKTSYNEQGTQQTITVTNDIAQTIKQGNTLSWQVLVDTGEKNPQKTDANYALSATVTDAMKNSGKNSKDERAITLDEKDPDVSVNSPALLTGSFANAKTTADTYELKNSTFISKLQNGNFDISGIQQGAIDSTQLILQLDSGGLEAPTRKVTGSQDSLLQVQKPSAQQVLESADIGDLTPPKVYLQKTLIKGEKDLWGNEISSLRNWQFQIKKEEFLSQENAELATDRHLIRVVTTSVSSSGAWEKKIQGWLVWQQDADSPWVYSLQAGDAQYKAAGQKEVYPSSNITGYACDDDGVQKVTYSIQKRGQDGSYSDLSPALNGEFLPQQTNQTYLTWEIPSPIQEGDYKITIDVIDTNGTQGDSFVRYFKSMDTSPPRITDVKVKDDKTALGDENANITFIGQASDDGAVQAVYMVYLDSSLAQDQTNKLKYIDGSYTTDQWAAIAKAGHDGTNLVYTLPLNATGTNGKLHTYSFEKTFNIFSDFGINGTTKVLGNQEFIFCVVDNAGQNTQNMLSVLGDSQAPEIKITTLVIKDATGQTKSTNTFTEGQYLTLSKFANQDSAIISGTWADDSVSNWTGVEGAKINPVEISWAGVQKNSITVDMKKDGTWSASVAAPLPQDTSSVIMATISDYAKNSKITTQSFSIESAKASWDKISCTNDDGSYKKGDVITITMNFNKNVSFSGNTAPPQLKLNNGGVAIYQAGNGTATHSFIYTVGSTTGEKDTQQITAKKLDAIALDAKGAVYKDTSTQDLVDVLGLPQGFKSLLGSTNIIIDTTPPTIKAITSSTKGFYKQGSTIIVQVEFQEDVTITGEDTITLDLNVTGSTQADKKITGGLKSGTKYMIFTYQVPSGVSSDPLGVVQNALSVPAPSSIKDAAGNALVATYPAALFSGVVIDTSAPLPPTITKKPNKDYITDSTGVTFTIAKDTTKYSDGTPAIKTLEYSLDGGTSWQTYSGPLIYLADDTYNIIARQTDMAGNISPLASSTAIVDKTDVLSKITADNTPSATYTTGDKITIDVKFTKQVALPTGSFVILNIANGTQTTTNATLVAGSATPSKSFSFEYTIQQGDGIIGQAGVSDGLLDVVSFSFSSVSVIDKNGATQQIPVAVPQEEASPKRFKENRQIKVLTQNPVVTNAKIIKEKTQTKLIVTYDRNIVKLSGNITLLQATQDKKAPAVLTSEQYQKLYKATSSIQNYYTEGVNGTTGQEANLEPDLTKKYILNFDKDITDTALVALFDAQNWYKVVVPITSSSVTIQDNELQVALSGSFALPTKGATYTLTLPSGLVADELSKQNSLYTSDPIIAPEVETPVIRVKKEKESIINNVAVQPDTSSVKVSCSTPSCTVYFRYKQDIYDQREFGGGGQNCFEKVTAPSSSSGSWGSYATMLPATTTQIGAGVQDNQGLKVTCQAYATKTLQDGTQEKSQSAYELALKTVLLFELGSYDDNAGINHNDNKIKDYSIWVRGGDSISGAVTTADFPVSWDDSAAGYSKVRLMTKIQSGEGIKGTYRWVSWQISTLLYLHFVAGDVPLDAAVNGPASWSWGLCAWVGMKDFYPLFPGACLKMSTNGSSWIGGEQRGDFVFKTISNR